MKTVFQKLFAIALIFAMALSFAGCSGSSGSEDTAVEPKTESPAENPKEYPIAICMDNMNHPVHRIVQLGFLKLQRL